MPYKHLKELPQKVQASLPEHAQKIYMKAYNNAIEEYKDPEKRRGGAKVKDSQEIVAHKVAWAAVKKKYKKEEIKGWVEKTEEVK